MPYRAEKVRVKELCQHFDYIFLISYSLQQGGSHTVTFHYAVTVASIVHLGE